MWEIQFLVDFFGEKMFLRLPVSLPLWSFVGPPVPQVLPEALGHTLDHKVRTEALSQSTAQQDAG